MIELKVFKKIPHDTTTWVLSRVLVLEVLLPRVLVLLPSVLPRVLVLEVLLPSVLVLEVLHAVLPEGELYVFVSMMQRAKCEEVVQPRVQIVPPFDKLYTPK